MDASSIDRGASMRADARRNRDLLLAAAEEVFDDEGPEATTEQVAARAGVAIGTVFRHFPTKPDLVEAVFIARLRRLAEHARDLVDAPDAEAAFFGFLETWTELSATKRAFADALAATGIDVAAQAERGEYPKTRDELIDAVDRLLKRAQEHGAVRADVGMDELNALLIGASRTAELLKADAELRSKTLGILFDGLRPRGRLGQDVRGGRSSGCGPDRVNLPPGPAGGGDRGGAGFRMRGGPVSSGLCRMAR